MKHTPHIIACTLILFLILSAGCIPLTHMSTAPVQKPGHIAVTTGVNTLCGENSGTAFNVGCRLGVAPRVDIGFIEDTLSTNIDCKVQLLTDETAHVDLSASAGVGKSVLAIYKYWNVIISKKTHKWTPFFAFRHTYINNNKTDTYDEDDQVGEIIYTLLTATTSNLNQFFLGTEYAISERTYFVMEAMFLPAEESPNLFAINTGFTFKF